MLMRLSCCWCSWGNSTKRKKVAIANQKTFVGPYNCWSSPMRPRKITPVEWTILRGKSRIGPTRLLIFNVKYPHVAHCLYFCGLYFMFQPISLFSALCHVFSAALTLFSAQLRRASLCFQPIYVFSFLFSLLGLFLVRPPFYFSCSFLVLFHFLFHMYYCFISFHCFHTFFSLGVNNNLRLAKEWIIILHCSCFFFFVSPFYIKNCRF